MVIVEQNLRLAFAVADRLLILRDGRVIEGHDMASGAASEEAIVRSLYL
jgi:ABC-type branched-subunit amino acid transport system ATPase component